MTIWAYLNRKLLGASLVALGALVIATRVPTAKADEGDSKSLILVDDGSGPKVPANYTSGTFSGYVAARGVVLRDDGTGRKVPVWADYPSDVQSINNVNYFAPAKPTELGLAVGAKEGAQVVDIAEYQFQKRAYDQLSSSDLANYDFLTKVEYAARKFNDTHNQQILAPLLSRTTHVMVRKGNLNTAADIVFHEFPFDPRPGSPKQPGPNDKTLLICTQSGAQLGQILEKSEGTITYLADFMGIDNANDTTQNLGSCAPDPSWINNYNAPNGDSVTLPVWDDLHRFEACDPWRVGNVWAPITGAYVDLGSRIMQMDDAPRTDGGGHFNVEYPYMNGVSLFDTLFVSLNFAPFDPRVPFGNRYFTQRKVITGATLKFDDTLANDPIQPIIGWNYDLAHPIYAYQPVLFDTHKPRGANVALDVSYMVGHIEMKNAERPGIRLGPGTYRTIIFDDDNNQTTYGYTRPDYAPRVATPYHFSTDGTSPTDQSPTISLLSPPDHSQVNDIDIEDRGLLDSISRSDISDTNYYLFLPDGRKVATRDRLRSNETLGLKCEGISSNPFAASATCTVEAHNGLAGFNLQDFVPNRYPGTRMKIVVINNKTGYLATGYALVDTKAGASATAAIKVMSSDGTSQLEMHPPNLSVKVERVRAPSPATGLDADASGPDSLHHANTIGFEGGALSNDQEIRITTTWVDWDGSPLPTDLPALTGRLARVSSDNHLDPVTKDNVGQFAIPTGTHLQFLRTANKDDYHYYLHVAGSAGHADFSASDGGQGPFKYRPRTYVPIKVPVFDELATDTALLAQIDLAKSGGSTVVNSVDPIYQWVYRPEYQFTVYDLPEIAPSTVVTQYDATKKRSTSSLAFDYSLTTAGQLNPLDPFDSGHNLVWGLGYEQLLAAVNGKTNGASDPNCTGTTCNAVFPDLESLLKLSPADQIKTVQDAISFLTPADYLGLQLYQDNDKGNALYQNYGIAYPLLVMDAAPIELRRRHDLATFGAEVASPLPFVDDYVPISFILTRPATIQVSIVSADGVVKLTTQEGVAPGKHYFVADSAKFHDANAPENSTLRFEALVDSGTGVSRVAHQVDFPVHLTEVLSGRALGEVVEGDVNIVDGSLRLSRSDFALGGRGPALAMARSYTNIGGDPESVLGTGWSHSFDLSLVPVSTDEFSVNSLPDWLYDLQPPGLAPRIYDPAQIEPHLYPSEAPQPTEVIANGATFRLTPSGTWAREKGRHGKLEVRDSEEGCTAKCFVFTAKDGTEYHYGSLPQLVPPTPGQLGSNQTSLSVKDGLAARLGIGLAGELHLPNPAQGTPGQDGASRLPAIRVLRIEDRFGNKLRFDPDPVTQELHAVTDDSGRSCEFSYNTDGSSGPSCRHSYKERTRLTGVTCLRGAPNDLQLDVSFCYDEHGNLESVTRGRRVETYGYARAGGGEDSDFNLVFTKTADGSQTDYSYVDPAAKLAKPAANTQLPPLVNQEVIDHITLPATLDRNDNEVRGSIFFGYGADGGPPMRTVTDPLPEVDGWPNDGSGGPSEGIGHRKEYTLNAYGNPRLIAEPLGKLTTLKWSIDEPGSDPSTLNDNLVISRTVTQDNGTISGHPKSVTTTFGYDGEGNLTLETLPGNRPITQTWNVFGQLTDRLDWRGVHESWHYDSRGFLESHTDPASITTTYTEEEGKPGLPGTALISEPSPLAPHSTPTRTLIFDYDDRGNLTSVKVAEANAPAAQSTFDLRGRLEFDTDPRGNTTHYEYSTNDETRFVNLPNLGSQTGPMTNTRLEMTYSNDGNKLTETDRNGVKYTFSYTKRNQVYNVKRSAEHDAERTLRYDLRGNVSQETDWLKKKITHDYDDLGFLDHTVNRNNKPMDTRHDLLGNVIQTVDYGGLVTNIDYDELNREIMRSPVCHRETCASTETLYDQHGAVPGPGEKYAVKIKSGGFTTELGYDARGLVVRRLDPEQHKLLTYYDAYRNVSQIIDEERIVTWYEYDSRGFLKDVSLRGRDGGEAPITVHYTPDENGNIKDVIRNRGHDGPGCSVNDGLEETTTTSYDAWNRPFHRDRPEGSEDFVYDGSGNIVSHTDVASHQRTWARDQLGRLVTYTDAETRARLGEATAGCLGTTCYSDYDDNGNPHQITTVRGKKTIIGYDDETRVDSLAISAPDAEPQSYQVTRRDSAGNPKDVTDRGRLFQFEYTERNRLEKETDPLGRTVGYTYTPRGQIDTVTKAGDPSDPRQFKRHFEYDGLARVKVVTYPNLSTIESEYDYNSVGDISAVHDHHRSVTENHYDNYGRVESVERYLQSGGQATTVIRNGYDDVGNVISTIDAKDHQTVACFDRRNFARQIIHPQVDAEPLQERIETRDFDPLGNVVWVVPPKRSDEAETKFYYGYDFESRLKSIRQASGALNELTSFDYDLAGNVTSEVHPEGQPGGLHAGAARTFKYDGMNRLSVVSDEVGIGTGYGYDNRGNLTDVVGPFNCANAQTCGAPTGRLVHTVFDPLNRRVNRTQSAGTQSAQTQYTSYDRNDNLTGLIDAKGQQFSFEYDHYSRRTSATYPLSSDPVFRPSTLPSGVSTSIHYDDANNIITTTEGKLSPGGTAFSDLTVETYDKVFSRRLLHKSERGAEISYGYDAVGNRTEVLTTAGRTGYDYDARNRLKTATIGASPIPIVFGYFPDGRLESISRPNQAETTIKYWDDRRVKTITQQFAGNVVATMDYTYDKNGNVRQKTDARPDLTEITHFDDYDAADRLKQFTVGAVQTNYEYEFYQRKTETVKNGAVTQASRTYNYDGLERLKSVVDSVSAVTISFGVDDNGNTISRDVSNQPGAGLTFTYNSRDQLARVTRGPPATGTVLGQYDYDSSGRRVRQLSSDRGDVDYFHDGRSVLEEVLTTGPGATSTVHYHQGPLGALALESDGDLQYYHQDDQGSVTQLSDSAGAPVAGNRFDPFGRVKSATGTTQNRQTYTGQEHDENTGLYYYGARYYDPDVGRFLSSDTYEGDIGNPSSLNSYQYAYSNPARYTDPTGHYPNQKVFCDSSGCPKRPPVGDPPTVLPSTTTRPGKVEDGGPILINPGNPPPTPATTQPSVAQRVAQQRSFTNVDTDRYGGSNIPSTVTQEDETGRQPEVAPHRSGLWDRRGHGVLKALSDSAVEFVAGTAETIGNVAAVASLGNGNTFGAEVAHKSGKFWHDQVMRLHFGVPEDEDERYGYNEHKFGTDLFVFGASIVSGEAIGGAVGKAASWGGRLLESAGGVIKGLELFGEGATALNEVTKVSETVTAGAETLSASSSELASLNRAAEPTADALEMVPQQVQWQQAQHFGPQSQEAEAIEELLGSGEGAVSAEFEVVPAKKQFFYQGKLGSAPGTGRAYGPFGELPEGGLGYQRHHLNQDAAFRESIPTDEGLATYLKGSINDVGGEHFAVHYRLERFYQYYRNLNEIPTLGRYNQAVYRGLREGGLTPAEARYLVERAAAQQRAFGLTARDLLPRLPDPVAGVIRGML